MHGAAGHHLHRRVRHPSGDHRPGPHLALRRREHLHADPPATTAGPYYFDADKVRADIREDREGVRLRVAVKVQDSGSCRPIKDAVVEIWHCDAGGLYSGAEAMSRGGGALSASSPDLDPQDDERYLRGAQVTNADGVVEFTTIWPGWYRGRCVHIHAMVHVSDARVLTTQMMFGEALNDRILAGRPYAARGERDTRNDGDGIFRDEMLMKVTPPTATAMWARSSSPRTRTAIAGDSRAGWRITSPPLSESG
ncbi:intradiol ring-cleavage dioxygenase [Nonomuraea ferruginea]